MTSLRRRIGAATTAAALIAGGAVGIVVVAVATAGTASAATVATLTHNDNACTTAASPNSPSLIAVGLGATDSDAGLTNTVDTTSGATVPVASNVTVANAATLAPTHSVLQGSSGNSLSAATGELFVSAAFVQAGVGLGLITIGQTVTADVSATIDAHNATFDATQPAGVTVNSPTQATLAGTGNASGTVVGTGTTVTGPIDAVGGLPNPNFTVPNTGGITAYFYQDSTAPAAPNTFPGDGTGTTTDSSAHIIAHLSTTLAVPLGCEPGTAPNPQPTPATWTQTAQSAVYIFADVTVAAAQPPTLVPQTIASVNLNGSAVIHAGAGATDNVPIGSYQIVAQPAHGSAAINAATGDVTYTNNGTGGGGGDSFTVTATSAGGTSAVTTETISSIVTNITSCTGGTFATPGGLPTLPGVPCAVNQIVLVPVTGSTITMNQGSGLPTDALGGTLNAGVCTPGTGITLNGQPQVACGVMQPLTITNATGLDDAWSVTIQTSDLVDTAKFALPTAAQVGTNFCDTVPGATPSATDYNNHCIPGGNIALDPVAAVAHAIVPGDTANVTPGAPVLAGLASNAPSVANAAGLKDAFAQSNPALAAYGLSTQTNPVTEMAAAPGFHVAAVTLCSTLSGHSGGTFICGGGLLAAIPASAAAPTAPGYESTVVATLVYT